MKAVGIAFIAIGLALLFYVLFNLFTEGDQIISPIPEERGVKVIIVTPGK